MSASVRALRTDRLLPRALHPGAWWAWGAGLVVVVSRTTDPIVLLAALAVTAVVVHARRGSTPRAAAFRLSLRLGIVVLTLRVVAQTVLGGPGPGRTLVTLPSVPLPARLAGIALGGPVTDVALVAALADGLRLVTVIAVIGAVTSLADPRRLLAALPPALHDLGVVLVVAVTFTPSLVAAVGRVRAARRLRGRPDRGPRGALTIVVPVLDAALSDALDLAASMDARGHGRRAAVAPAARRRAALLTVLGLAGAGIGLLALLDGGTSRPTALAWLGAGTLTSLRAMALAGRDVRRTRHRPDPWRVPEHLTAAAGSAVALIAVTATPAATGPWFDGTAIGAPAPAILAALLVGLLPAAVTPRPPDHRRALDPLLALAGPSPTPPTPLHPQEVAA
jgi:energy-coupling factor transport system permease protein